MTGVQTCALRSDLAPKSLATVGLGTCAAYGGIPAAAGNVTEAKGLRDFFAEEKIDKLLVNVPGCPPHPDWMVGTLVAAWSHVLNPEEHPLPELDDTGLMLVMPIFCITRRWVRYSCPNVIQKRAHWSVGKFFVRLSNSS